MRKLQRSVFLIKIEKDLWLWHARLGHVNLDAITLMNMNEMVRGLPKLVHPKAVCKGCLMAKQNRAPFPTQLGHKSSKVMELIHGDIFGPITPFTPSGKRYFLLLVDDFSIKMWVYFLLTKDEEIEEIKKFKKLWRMSLVKKLRHYV